MKYETIGDELNNKIQEIIDDLIGGLTLTCFANNIYMGIKLCKIAEYKLNRFYNGCYDEIAKRDFLLVLRNAPKKAIENRKIYNAPYQGDWNLFVMDIVMNLNTVQYRLIIETKDWTKDEWDAEMEVLKNVA